MVWADADIFRDDRFIPDEGRCPEGSSCPPRRQPGVPEPRGQSQQATVDVTGEQGAPHQGEAGEAALQARDPSLLPTSLDFWPGVNGEDILWTFCLLFECLVPRAGVTGGVVDSENCERIYIFVLKTFKCSMNMLLLGLKLFFLSG